MRSGRLQSLDRIVDITAKLFGTPMAAVNVIAAEETLLAGQVGFGDYTGSSRDDSFCGHTINQNEMLVVNDALLDDRFHDNPLVMGGIVRFYAGVTIRSPEGYALGALCIIDPRPRTEYDAQNLDRLHHLARLVEDELELHRLAQAAAVPASRMATVAEMSANAVACFDSSGRITDCNTAAAAMFGYQTSEIIGKPIQALLSDEDGDRVSAAMRRVLAGGKPASVAIEMTGVRSTGERFPIEHFWHVWREGDNLHFGTVVKDLTERHRERAALDYLTNYDEQTGLPNRHLLHRQAAQLIGQDRPLALVTAEISGISEVNNTLGHAAGEKVLRIAADRIKAAVPARSVVGRLAFKQFAILLPEPAEASTVTDAVHHIRAILAEPIRLDSGEEIRIGSSLGIATGPDHAGTAEELMSNAELALFQARHSGGTAIYTPTLRSAAIARRLRDVELHRAFEKGEFTLFYQPQVRMDTGAVTGSEALIRWRHPTMGLLAPASFLSQVEAVGLAVPVGTWVMETACAQLSRWRDHRPDLRVSVNLFAEQFRTGTLPAQVMDCLAAHHLPPEQLELEITENIVLHDELQILPQLVELRRAGVHLSFDDFGTGFASLNILREYPVTSLKVDKSFTQALMHSAPDRAIVRSIIGLAHELKLGVVAEGIETQDHVDFLSRLSCDRGQGYFYGKPMPADVFRHHYLVRAA